MSDRLAYALLGAVFGAMTGVVVWLLLGFGAWPRGSLSIRGAGLVTLAEYMALIGAVLGFTLKGKIGDIVGSVIATIFSIRTGTPQAHSWEVPNWLKVAVAVSVAIAIWHFA
ncbi:MAG: hypothetical protein Q8Q82_00795 [Hydrogenophaga sp.]|nr:hypothetical protein [Hydrogenophaga sp.]MDZ4359030.1 hypothetical protein [Variovorax sp.]